MPVAAPDIATLAVWGGETAPNAEGAAQVPIFQTAPFAYPDMDSWLAASSGRTPGHLYSRATNPTLHAFEEKARLLEGGEAATSFSSGMAAISNGLLSVLKPGQRLVSLKDCYGGTSQIFLHHLPQLGIEVDLVDTSDAALEAALQRPADMVYLETPTNPTLKVIDLRRSIGHARAAGAVVMVDNTVATPVNQQPLALGADLVAHSATKYLGGHDDVLGGVLIGRKDLVEKAHHYRQIGGGALAPLSAYLLLRGMKTLSLRVRQQNETAMAMARALSADQRVEAVFYPGLESHPGHAVAREQMSGFGGILSFALKGDPDRMKRFLDGLQIAQRAGSLGSVTTLVGIPATTSHLECSADERASLGIPETLVRYSCGIEAVDDLLADVRQALDRAYGRALVQVRDQVPDRAPDVASRPPASVR